VVAVADRFAAPEGLLYEIRCPMAFDGRGATWLQTTPEVSNPYFGDVMPKCGEVTRVLSAPREGGHPHE
jgi:Cu(I)/Ag(I) efflux system membrane fusion protein